MLLEVVAKAETLLGPQEGTVGEGLEAWVRPESNSFFFS